MSLTEETEGVKEKPQYRTTDSPTIGHASSFSPPSLIRSKSTSQLQDPKAESGTIVMSDEPDKWCIYRVPSKLRSVKTEAYTPQLLSIGLFHHGKAELQDMENNKKIYVEYFFKQASKDRDAVRSFIEGQKEKILHCYAGMIELGDIDLVEMILVDACFIIGLFLMNDVKRDDGGENTKDYILSSPWVYKAAEQDLILFENQLPYFLLQELYDFAKFPEASSISLSEKDTQSHKSCANNKRNRFTLDCFQQYFMMMDHVAPVAESHDPVDEPKFYHDNFLKLAHKFFKYYSDGKSIKVKPKHFTDLIRQYMCPDEETLEWKNNTTNSIYSMRKLTAAGVNFMPFPKDGRFVVKEGDIFSLTYFKTMDLKLSQFCVKDETECIIRNVMAVEQFLYPEHACVCNYFLLMDKLVDTVEDVEYLIRQKVIVNMLGSKEAVVNLVNHLCDHILEEKSCYVHICEQLNKHYENSWNRHVTTLRRVYFRDLWTSSSTFFGIVVLVFSIIGSIKSFK